jgi:hypothetical protein
MDNLTEKRLRRLRGEGRLHRVRSPGVSATGDRTASTVSAVCTALKEKWGVNAYAAVNFCNLQHGITSGAKNANIAYLISHGGQWSEVLFVHATNSRIVPIRKYTYDPPSGWSAHLGHPGGQMRAAVFEAFQKIKPMRARR